MGMNDFFFESWRQTAIPAWRKVLKESIEQKNANREKYARFILKDILEDIGDIIPPPVSPPRTQQRLF
jgi:hypothetical protein